jgi:hypothetical protein
MELKEVADRGHMCQLPLAVINSNSEPTDQLCRSRYYWVKVFELLEPLSGADAVSFLKDQKALLVGMPGLALVCRTHHQKLPAGKPIVMLDDLKKLAINATQYEAPVCRQLSVSGLWKLELLKFGQKLSTGTCLICFQPNGATNGLGH